MTGQIRQSRFENLDVPTDVQRLDGYRDGARELQDFLGRMLTQSDSGGGVIRGFNVSEGAARRSDVTPGSAIIYDATATDPLSAWSWVPSETTLQDTHAPHSSDPRIDLLTLTHVAADDTSQTMLRAGGGTVARNTQRGTTVALEITQGTPSVSPVAPSVPAGHFLLYRVYVPATSGALEYLDRRNFVGVIERGDVGPRANVLFGDQPVILKAKVNPSAHGDPAAWTSQAHYDTAEDWLSFIRARGATLEATGTFYPMAIRNSRRWKRTVPWADAKTSDATGEIEFQPGDPGTIYKLGVNRTGTGTASASAVVGVPVDSRDLRAITAKVRYEVQTAVDSLGSFTVALLLVHTDGTVDVIGLATSGTELANTAAGVVEGTLAMASTPVIVDGDFLLARFAMTTNAGAATGRVILHSVDVEFKEGQG
jgi:hypothetical protein